MKKIIYLLVISLGIISCKEYLDVKPKGTVIPDTVEEYDLMLNEVPPMLSYIQIDDPDYEMNKEAWWLVTKENILKYTWDEFRTLPDGEDQFWNSAYRQIYYCNEIITNIDKAALGEADEKGRMYIKGQAHAQRALIYFSLVNAYGKHYNTNSALDLGVPIITYNDIEQKRARATVKEVYDFIFSDLEIALDNCPEDHIYIRTRATVLGIKALISKIYLYQADYKKALEYAQEVLEEYSFLYDYNDPSTHPKLESKYDNKETIWELPVLTMQQKTKSRIAEHLIALYDTDNDLRYQLEVTAPLPWDNYYARSGNIYRTGGMSVPHLYLISAECKARLDDINGAMQDLNHLLSKRYSLSKPVHSASNKEEALNIIFEERRKELIYTANNFFDLKRYQAEGRSVSDFSRTYQGKTYTLESGSKRYVFDIPRGVISLNNKLIQNER